MHVFVLNTKDDIVKKVCNRAASGIIDSAPHVMQYILGLMKSVLFFLEIHFFPLIFLDSFLMVKLNCINQKACIIKLILIIRSVRKLACLTPYEIHFYCY